LIVSRRKNIPGLDVCARNTAIMQHAILSSEWLCDDGKPPEDGEGLIASLPLVAFLELQNAMERLGHALNVLGSGAWWFPHTAAAHTPGSTE